MKTFIAALFSLALGLPRLVNAEFGIFNHTEVERITFPVNGLSYVVFANARVINGTHGKVQIQEVSVGCTSDADGSYSKGYTSRAALPFKAKGLTHPHSFTVFESSPPIDGNITCILRVMIATVVGDDVIHDGGVSDVTLNHTWSQ